MTALNAAEIPFIHRADDSVTTRDLDFYLPRQGVFIICHAFPTQRIMAQLEKAPDNTIVIVGKKAALQLALMIAG